MNLSDILKEEFSYSDTLREEFKHFFQKWLKLDDKPARLELDKIALKIKELRGVK